MLLGKDILNTIKVLISKALIDSYISHDEFFSVNNKLRKYNKIKEEIKNPQTYIKTMETYCISCKKYNANKNSSVRKLNKID